MGKILQTIPNFAMKTDMNFRTKIIVKPKLKNWFCFVKYLFLHKDLGNVSNILQSPHFSMSLSPLCPCTFSSIGNCPGTIVHRCQSCTHPHSCHMHYSVVAGLTADCPSCFDSAFSFPPGSGDRHRTCVYLKTITLFITLNK